MFDEQTFWDIVDDVHEDYEVIGDSWVEETGRWHILNGCIVRNRNESTYLRIYYRTPATEYQEVEPAFYAEPVEPFNVTVTEWRVVK